MLKHVGVAAAAVVASFAMAAPASAHVIEVTNQHTGLVTACGAEQADVLKIYTFWNPLNSCTHFGP